jgi:hypothetical protein
MNIMELGAIGEALGGIAVLVTLVYLALQVRQGNQQNRSESTRALMLAYNDLLHDLSEASFAEVFRRASSDYSALPRSDQIRASSFLERSWRISFANYVMDPRSENPLTDLVDTSFAITLKSAGFGEWWQHFRSTPQSLAASEYVLRIDGLLASPDVPTLQEILPCYEPDDAETGGRA